MESERRFKEFLDHHAYLSSIENLTLNFGPLGKPGDHPLEQVFFSRLFQILQKWEGFSTFNFFIVGVTHPYDLEFDEKSIVFCISNEDHKIPKDIQKAGLIFSPYAPNDELPHCLPIPLGYNGSLYDLPVKNINERPFDVFFSGNIYKKRLNFYLGARIYRFINRLKKWVGMPHCNDHMQFNRKFTGGMDPKEYSEILVNSKIALVPEGYLSDISFRFFEAAKMGCVIISKELNDHWFFQEFPGIETKNWINLYKHIHTLISDEKALKKLQDKMMSYYEKYCSEEATAEFIIQKLADLGNAPKNDEQNLTKTQTVQ